MENLGGLTDQFFLGVAEDLFYRGVGKKDGSPGRVDEENPFLESPQSSCQKKNWVDISDKQDNLPTGGTSLILLGVPDGAPTYRIRQADASYKQPG